MKLKRKLTVILLTAVLLIGSLPLTALPGAAEGPNARLIHADVRVYAGGLYNIDANCDDPDAVYKWVCWYDDDHYVELPDNDGYHGTDTPHFSFTTTDGKAGDKDWGSLRFGCKVTSHGKDYLTDTYNMHIMSKTQLRRDLEEDGYGISRFGIVGGTFVGETDGVLYYDLPAGGSFPQGEAHRTKPRRGRVPPRP